MDSLLVITNNGAGTADDETLDRALAALFDEVSVEVVATSNPGELDGVLHRAGLADDRGGRRRRQPARRGGRPAPPARPERRPCSG